LRFEHLVEINDPANPTLEPLTADQLWQGLVLRAESPELFMLGLDGPRSWNGVTAGSSACCISVRPTYATGSYSSRAAPCGTNRQPQPSMRAAR
jgi:hypothetical protein